MATTLEVGADPMQLHGVIATDCARVTDANLHGALPKGWVKTLRHTGIHNLVSGIPVVNTKMTTVWAIRHICKELVIRNLAICVVPPVDVPLETP